MSVFIKATRSGWYPEFLKPVVDSVLANPTYKQILDIGTGPGTLPQLLIAKNLAVQITGIDTSKNMIEVARKSVSHNNVFFQHQQENASLPFATQQFDAVTFCSVLFLLDDNTKSMLMNEALRVLKPEGKIIVLTPSGEKAILSALFEVWRYRFSVNNFTFLIWKLATTRRARKWKRQKWLENYALNNELKYTVSLAFNNNATVEIISK
jgi:ubiquinone/menaquinone biosynthesis C-methylase UbiE